MVIEGNVLFGWFFPLAMKLLHGTKCWWLLPGDTDMSCGGSPWGEQGWSIPLPSLGAGGQLGVTKGQSVADAASYWDEWVRMSVCGGHGCGGAGHQHPTTLLAELGWDLGHGQDGGKSQEPGDVCGALRALRNLYLFHKDALLMHIGVCWFIFKHLKWREPICHGKWYTITLEVTMLI